MNIKWQQKIDYKKHKMMDETIEKKSVKKKPFNFEEIERTLNLELYKNISNAVNENR